MTAPSRPRWPYPRIFAHRCGGTLAPENTLVGLKFAQRFGAGVEFDVMLSGSGSPVLIHDDTLDRTTSGRGRVADTADEVLRTLDAGSRFSAEFSGECVPTLEEAAKCCIELGLAVNLEIKPSAGQDVLTGHTVACAAARLWRGAALPPLLSSFSEQALQVAAEVSPELPRGLLVSALPPDWAERCRRLEVLALHVQACHLDRSRIGLVRDAGLWVVAYTENDPMRVRTLFEWGVDCMISDRPDLIDSPDDAVQ